MNVTEVIGDSLREVLDFIATKLAEAPQNASVLFLGKKLSDIRLLSQHYNLSNIEISLPSEDSYVIHFPERKDLFVNFSCQINQNFDFIIVLFPDDTFNDLITYANKKLFLLSDKTIKWPRTKNIIQLGLPETWLEF